MAVAQAQVTVFSFPQQVLNRRSAAMRNFLLSCLAVGALWTAATLGYGQTKQPVPKWPEHIQLVLDNTKPLKFDRGRRLPLYLWPAMNPGRLDEATAEVLVRELDRRGIGLICSWRPDEREQCLTECLPVARAQKKCGLRININANACLYSFFDNDKKTAHIDANGEPFRDKSFGKKNMGCPFAIEHRRKIIRERIEWYADAYAREGLTCDFVFADWEIDGPLEWNGAWEASKKCRRCRKNIPDIDSNFLQFQKVIRDLRSDIQNDVYAEPLLSRFPDVLVGNYALYPHDGFRYWYDYFEKYVPGQPAVVDQKAHYRHWANDFEATGYTFAMPTVYPWSWTWQWYDFEPGDYRWFYNMLKVAGNAGRHTPHNIPIISFVHWHTVMVGQKEDRAGVQQFSERNYQELLWHMLLRGHDTFFLWCAKRERVKEVQLLHPVWAAAQQYGEFLKNGVPICFDVPRQPGPVISGLRLGNRVLVRRTDFTDQTEPVEIKIGAATLTIPYEPGKCRIFSHE